MIKRSLYYCLFLGLIFSLSSCTSAKSQSKKGEEYDENISMYRIKYDSIEALKDEASNLKNKEIVLPKNDITKPLHQKLDTLAKRNSSYRSMQGYRILVYSGKNGEEVRKVKTKLYEVMPEVNIYPEFKSPNQRIKAGDCVDRIEAYNLLGKLKKYFPNAVIIPDQVIIKAK